MMRALALALLVVAGAALAGCSDKKKAQDEDVVPGEISRSDLENLDRLVTEKHPRFFGFPGQVELPLKQLYFNDTLAAGDGAIGVEVPNDEGVIDSNGFYKAYDLQNEVPVGQPVEMRLKLRWTADPGASADLDIYVNVPGTHDAFTPDRFDESLNWNIITKFRVVNTVRLADQPFEVGIQAANGKNLQGVAYSVSVELHFPSGVLAPGVPYRLSVPDGASVMMFESEPVVGDEHIDSEVMLIGPDQALVRYVKHNDIATETTFINLRQAGDYVLYAPTLHGGFLRVQLDLPNPQANATLLQLVETEGVLAANAVAAAGAVPGAPNTSGQFSSGETFPLDISPYLRVTAPLGFTGTLNVTFSTSKGPVSSLAVDGNGQMPQDGQSNRVGFSETRWSNRGDLEMGTVAWTMTGSAAPLGAGGGVEVGYVIKTYSG